MKQELLTPKEMTVPKHASKNKENTTVTDEDVNLDDLNVEPEAPVSDEASSEPTTGGDKPKAKSKKDPVPDGYMKPTALAKVLDIRPQIVYGYIKNGKNFPFTNNTDGSFIVPVGSGDPETDAQAWIEDRRAKTAARKAAKAEEATKAEEAAAG